MILLPEFFLPVVTDSARMIIIYVNFKIFFTIEGFITAIHRCPTFICWTDVVWQHIFITIVAWDCPGRIFNWGHSQSITVTCWLSHSLRGRGRGGLQLSVQLGFSMLHPLMLPQPLFRSVCVVTLVTGKWGNSSLFYCGVHSWRGLPLLGEELFSAPGISPLCGGAFLLLAHKASHCLAPGFQGEGKAGAHVEGEVESLALDGQCLAEVHALGNQGRVDITHCSHFGFTSEISKGRSLCRTCCRFK